MPNYVTIMFSCQMVHRMDVAPHMKVKTPCCFQNVKTLPISYELYRNSWLTSLTGESMNLFYVGKKIKLERKNG